MPLYFPAQGDSSKCQESCSMWLLESHHIMKKKRESEKDKKDKSSKPTLLVTRHEIQREIVAHHPLFLAISRTLKIEPLVDSPHCLENLVEEFQDSDRL